MRRRILEILNRARLELAEVSRELEAEVATEGERRRAQLPDEVQDEIRARIEALEVRVESIEARSGA